MTPLSDPVKAWLLARRGEVNTLVRDRSSPGPVRDAGVAAGLRWLEALWRSAGELDLFPLELALDLAGRGLLKDPGSLVEPVAWWMELFPRALKEAGKHILISWIHLLIRLEPHGDLLKKMENWLGQLSCGELDRENVLRLLAACVWLSGLPVWRKAGLEALAALPEETAAQLRALAAGAARDRPPSFWSGLAVNPLGPEPWTRAAGGALDFTGPWEAPPEVELQGASVLARQGGKVWEVICDCFGVQLVPVQLPAPAPGQPAPQKARKGWQVRDNALLSPSGKVYPFPFGRTPVLHGVEREDGLAVVGSTEFFSLLLLYRGPQ